MALTDEQRRDFRERGLTQRERALTLIDLAHPRFRAELCAEAHRRFWPEEETQ